MNIAEKAVVTLNFSHEYQGKIILIRDAEEIKTKQQEIISRSFSEGFKQIKDNTQTEFTDTLIQYLYKVDRGEFLNNPEDFQKEQEVVFHLIHTAHLTDTNKIFYEYLIGLSRFVISIQLLYCYLKDINAD